MYEGKIIKFYREKKKITQEQLCKGICSATHISKIERGLTEYSPEITTLLASKLDINIERELGYLTNIKEKLNLWHEMILSQNMQEAKGMSVELANNHLIQISQHNNLYQLLQVKYNLKQGDLNYIQGQLRVLCEKSDMFPPFEKNLFKHVLGIYYMATEDHSNSIKILRSIDFDSYSNPLVYYDLAVAYHYIHSPVLAYYYAEKALRLYKMKNDFLGVIDTENLMIIQVETDQHRDFKETIEQFEKLIRICDLCNEPDKKAKVLHNFAYEHLRRKNYVEANRLYKESMDLKKRNTGIYLLSLEGYIRSAFEGGLLSKEELLEQVHIGLEISKKINDTLYKTVLTLHHYLIVEKIPQYYRYLTSKAIPYFKEHGYTLMTQRYETELFKHYSRKGDVGKAMEIAEIIVRHQEELII